MLSYVFVWVGRREDGEKRSADAEPLGHADSTAERERREESWLILPVCGSGFIRLHIDYYSDDKELLSEDRCKSAEASAKVDCWTMVAAGI